MITPKCPKCKLPMEEGFIVDRGPGAPAQAQWVEGPPQKSIWFGMKLGGKELRNVTTFCCPRCGYLESYAQIESQ